MSMALIPALAALGRRAAVRLTPEGPADPELSVSPTPAAGATIVVGYGRVGKVVCALLKEHGRPFLAVDLDAVGVSRDRRQGHAVYYGDASNASFLKSCGIGQASALIITLNNADAIDAVVDNVRQIRPDIPIFSRARDAAHARHLYALGVTDAVPETIEASLQLLGDGAGGHRRADRAGHRLDPRQARRVPGGTPGRGAPLGRGTEDVIDTPSGRAGSLPAGIRLTMTPQSPAMVGASFRAPLLRDTCRTDRDCRNPHELRFDLN